MYLEGRKEELGMEGGKTVIRIYYMRKESIFNKRSKRLCVCQHLLLILFLMYLCMEDEHDLVSRVILKSRQNIFWMHLELEKSQLLYLVCDFFS